MVGTTLAAQQFIPWVNLEANLAQPRGEVG
jgi:hypothetical protein